MLDMKKHENKTLRDFSSGMKQKVKLALCIYSDSPILFLDEPTSNLDNNNIEWYQQKISKVKETKIIFVASNQQYEYDFCDSTILITDFKL